MQIIPLAVTPSQTLDISLAGQACTINVYRKFYGMFCDLFVNNSPIIQGVLCLNKNYIVRSLYLGFHGDLGFFDTQDNTDPDWTGFGGRFLFVYLATSDLPPTYGLSS